METYFNKSVYRKNKRFLIQTGSNEITSNFIKEDGTSNFETRIIPSFEKFIQVICNSKFECIQLLELQGINYTVIHEVKHPLYIDSCLIHEQLFSDVPPNLRN